MDENIKKKIERIKEIFVEECGCTPTDENIQNIVRMYTEGPTSCQAEIKRKLEQLEYLLSNPYIYKHWKSAVEPVFEDLKALAKWEMEAREKWWSD